MSFRRDLDKLQAIGGTFRTVLICARMALGGSVTNVRHDGEMGRDSDKLRKYDCLRRYRSGACQGMGATLLHERALYVFACPALISRKRTRNTGCVLQQ